MILFSRGIVIIWRVRLKCLFMDSDNQSGLVRGCHPTNKNIPLIEFLFKITTLDLSCWWSFKKFTSKFSFNLSKTVFINRTKMLYLISHNKKKPLKNVWFLQRPRIISYGKLLFSSSTWTGAPKSQTASTVSRKAASLAHDSSFVSSSSERFETEHEHCPNSEPSQV